MIFSLSISKLLAKNGFNAPTKYVFCFKQNKWMIRKRKASSPSISLNSFICATTLNEIPLPVGWHTWQERSGLWYYHDNFENNPFGEPLKGYKTELRARAEAWIKAKEYNL